MNKKWLIFAMLLVSSSIFVTACGVSNDQYATVLSERDVAKSQLSSVNIELEKTKGELALAQSQLQTTTTELDKANAALDKTNSDLASTNSKLQVSGNAASAASSTITQLQQSMAKAKVLAEIISVLFVPFMKQQTLTPAQEDALYTSFISKVTNSGDPKLLSLYVAWVDSNYGDSQGTAFFVYIFEALPQLLQTISSTSSAY